MDRWMVEKEWLLIRMLNFWWSSYGEGENLALARWSSWENR